MITKLNVETKKFQQELGQTRQSIEDLERRCTAELDKIKDLFDAKQEYFEQRRQEIELIVGSVASTSLSGEFSKSAEAEGRAADLYRIYGIGAMSIAAGIAVATFILSFVYPLTLSSTIIKTLTLVLVSAPAAYLVRESSRHRENQHIFQQTSLDLRSISPYLAPLEPAAREKIMADLAVRLFARPRLSRRGVTMMDADLKELVLKLIEKINLKG